jgi:hypothetical protein
MRRVKNFLLAALVVAVAVLSTSNAAQQKDKGDKKEETKYTIKQVMKTAHEKDVGLFFQAKAGTIKPEDKKKLAEMYVALGTLKPEKGDAESWKKFTDPIVVAAKDYGDGKDEKAEKLSKALQCKACHTVHR